MSLDKPGLIRRDPSATFAPGVSTAIQPRVLAVRADVPAGLWTQPAACRLGFRTCAPRGASAGRRGCVHQPSGARPRPQNFADFPAAATRSGMSRRQQRLITDSRQWRSHYGLYRSAHDSRA
ncbi:hypothetical protein BDA96_06G147800 [Sorghum bicolor]|uniref:Uncharacterized protein n=1 Tax=Sorghum bicolor TaxID=4558 RepID=A0A921QTR3_SORBI|nr:hypothetical protein BDA96_06G147800 [Sorghum bicolor]